jgi:hypothetical protein
MFSSPSPAGESAPHVASNVNVLEVGVTLCVVELRLGQSTGTRPMVAGSAMFPPVAGVAPELESSSSESESVGEGVIDAAIASARPRLARAGKKKS